MRQYTSGNDLIRIATLVGDFVVLNVLLWLSLYVLPEIDPGLLPPYMSTHKPLTWVVGNFAMIVSEQSFHAIVHRRRVHLVSVIANVFKLTMVQAVLMFVFLRIVGDPGQLFRFMVIFAVVLFAAISIVRQVEWSYILYMRSHGRNSRSVVLVGNDPALLELYDELCFDISTGFKVKGYYADKPMERAPKELTYLGTMEQLFAAMEKSDSESPITRSVAGIDDLFCCLSHDRSDDVVRLMRFCDRNMVRFFYLPRRFGEYSLNLKPEYLGEVQIYCSHEEPLSRLGNKVLKRGFDICFSALVCLVLLPLLPVIAIIIKSQSRGPLFFRQKRTGVNGKTFTCLKFRSMHVNKDSDMVQATKNDPRKFPFGDFMRRTNIDELPQFFNVLRGDMSVVGPRPHMLHHTEVYGNIIDKYMVRHFCRPGITGWAQVTGSRGETKELWQMEERVRKDVWYIEHWTFWLDLRIIARTVGSVFHHDKQAY